MSQILSRMLKMITINLVAPVIEFSGRGSGGGMGVWRERKQLSRLLCVSRD